MTQLCDHDLVAEFLKLPPEAMPAAVWLDTSPEFAGSPWPYLRDFLLPEAERELDHDGEPIRLRADRPEWANGCVVYAG